VAAVTAPAVSTPAQTSPAPPRRVGVRARRRRRLTAFRAVVLVSLGGFFLLPYAALVEFSTRGTGLGAPRTLGSWRAIGEYPELTSAIVVSLELAVITSVAVLALLVPTMVWVRLRLPRMGRVVEFLCLLPLTVPAIALVVGLAPLYLWVTYFFGDSTLTLGFVYLVLVLPFAYRALDTGLAAMDLSTLSEAARSLGAGWGTVLWRVVVPNLRTAMLNAALLSVALVLGEFTIANLLNYPNMQYVMNLLGQSDPGVTVAVSAASLLFAFLLLLALSFVGGRARRQTRAMEE
jgi:putative spermidine/putrescine transport system permease protein